MDPLHLHLGKDTPIHLHVQDSNKNKSKSRSANQMARSVTEMSAGRPGMRAQNSLAKTGAKLFWNSPTHTLQIQTPNRLSIRTPDTGQGPALELTDLKTSVGGRDVGTSLILESNGTSNEELKDAQNKIKELESEVEIERTLRRVEKLDKIEAKRSSSEPSDSQAFKASESLLHQSESDALLRQARVGIDTVRELQETREFVVRKLLEAEMLSAESSRLTDKMRRTIQKIDRGGSRSTASSYDALAVSELNQTRDELLKTLAEYDACNSALRRLLRDQHDSESRVKESLSQQEILLGRLLKSEEAGQSRQREIAQLESEIRSCRKQLTSSERITETNLNTSKRLTAQIDESGRECERLREKLQNFERNIEDSNYSWKLREQQLENRISHKEAESAELRNNLKNLKTMNEKLETSQDKFKQDLHGKTSDIMTSNETIQQLEAKLTKTNRHRVQLETENRELSNKISELEEILHHSKETAKLSLDSLSKRLMEKTQALGTQQVESSQLASKLSTASDKLQNVEQIAETRVANAAQEIAQLQSSLTHFESLVTEYRTQIEDVKRENVSLHGDLACKEAEVERYKNSEKNSIEFEKIKFQQKVSEMEPLSDIIREKDVKIALLNDRLLAQEEQLNKLHSSLSELSYSEKEQTRQLELSRDKLFASVGENKSLIEKMSETEKRITDADIQNKEIITIITKKEDAVQRLQTRMDELTTDNLNLSRQLDSAKTDSRKQQDQLKDRLTAKERSIQGKVTDLEGQLAQLTAANGQLKKSKEDSDRRYTSRVADMKEKLEHANASTRSMQNYIQFLKSSYASVFSDPDTMDKPITY